jgi:uncharacterized cupredoxin-like copper-binding protein
MVDAVLGAVGLAGPALAIALSTGTLGGGILRLPICLGGRDAIAGPGVGIHDEHGAGSAAGEAGDPAQPARVVRITMAERGGRMLYLPDRIQVRRNEQIRFVLNNTGGVAHEFVLGSAVENKRHAEEMQKFPGMVHDGPNARTLGSAHAAEMVWRFTKPGTYEYSCLIPGHRDAGMMGTVVVR